MSDSNNSQQPVRFLTDTMLSYLWIASPWLRFVGVVVYIGSILMMLFGAIMAVGASFAATYPIPAVLPGDAGVFLGLVCVGIGVLMFFPAQFIYSSGSRIRDYFLSNSERELEIALESGKSFWKFLGIMLIILLALVPAGLAFTIAAKTIGLW